MGLGKRQLKRAEEISVMVEVFLSFASVALEVLGLQKSSIRSVSAASLPDHKVGSISSVTFQIAS